MPISIRERKSRFSSLIYPASLVWTGICILLYYSNTSLDILEFVVFNTDQLILAAIYEDIFLEGNPFTQWHLTPAPYFFPDMLLYFPVRALSGNFLVAHFVYTTVQVFIILLLFRWVIRKLDANIPDSIFIAGHTIIGLYILGGVISHTYLFSQMILSIAQHSGNIISALLVAGLALSAEKKKSIRPYILLFFLIIFSVASDKLIVPIIIAPYTIMIICRFMISRNISGWAILMVLVTATVAGMFISSAIRNNIIESPKPHYNMNWENAWETLYKGLYARLLDRENGLLLIMAWLSVILSVAVLPVRKLPSSFRLFSLTMVCSFILLHAFPVYLGIFFGTDCFRYTIGAEILMLLTLPLNMYMLTKKKMVLYIFTGLLVLYPGIRLISSHSKIQFAQGLRYYFTFKHPDSIVLDQHAHLLKNGTGPYWQSKLVQLCSEKGIKVRSVLEGGIPNFHEASSAWFISGQPVVFNFSYLQKPGYSIPVIDSIPCYYGYIYITPDFCYHQSDEIGYYADHDCSE